MQQSLLALDHLNPWDWDTVGRSAGTVPDMPSGEEYASVWAEDQRMMAEAAARMAVAVSTVASASALRDEDVGGAGTEAGSEETARQPVLHVGGNSTPLSSWCLDIETGDPDDIIMLLICCTHPAIRSTLKCVTVTPGSRSQVALVRWILKRLGLLEQVKVGATDWGSVQPLTMNHLSTGYTEDPSTHPFKELYVIFTKKIPLVTTKAL